MKKIQTFTKPYKQKPTSTIKNNKKQKINIIQTIKIPQNPSSTIKTTKTQNKNSNFQKP